MCEILFRGKTSSGEWVEGFYLYTNENTQPVIIDMECCSNVIIPETVGQYTGLTDKNGKKIFEGDIVRAFTRFSEIYVSPVAYHDGTFWFKNWSWTKFLFKFEKIEVIGNIHDNPELLKVW